MRACVCRIHDLILKQANGIAILKRTNQPNELKTTLQVGKKFQEKGDDLVSEKDFGLMGV